MHIEGLRIFLFALVAMLQKKIEFPTCQEIEDNLSKGIASYLNSKYDSVFKEVGYSETWNKDIDKKFATFDGIANGNESRKYFIDNDNGILLLLALYFNEIS